MKKFVILNCPAYSYNEQLPGFDGCLCKEFEGLNKKCAERDNCVMKQIYNKFREQGIFDYLQAVGVNNGVLEKDEE